MELHARISRPSLDSCGGASSRERTFLARRSLEIIQPACKPSYEAHPPSRACWPPPLKTRGVLRSTAHAGRRLPSVEAFRQYRGLLSILSLHAFQLGDFAFRFLFQSHSILKTFRASD